MFDQNKLLLVKRILNFLDIPMISSPSTLFQFNSNCDTALISLKPTDFFSNDIEFVFVSSLAEKNLFVNQTPTTIHNEAHLSRKIYLKRDDFKE